MAVRFLLSAFILCSWALMEGSSNSSAEPISYGWMQDIQRAAITRNGKDTKMPTPSAPYSSSFFRSKRAVSRCSVVDRKVLSKDVGMGDAAPEVINIKMCAGECPVHYGSFGSHYARTLYLHHKRKGMHIPDESWKPTCQITAMESINLFFNRTVGNETIFEEKEIKNMVVKSCGCRIHSCVSD